MLMSARLRRERVQPRRSTGIGSAGHSRRRWTSRLRYVSSRLNLIELLPYVSELYVFDNSVEVGVDGGDAPEPILIVHMASWMTTIIHSTVNHC